MNRKQRTTRPIWWEAALAGLSGAALVTACGSVTPSGPASPTEGAPIPNGSPTEGVALPCSQITSLRISLADVASMSAGTASVRRLTRDVERAGTDLTALRSRAGAFSGQASELNAELSHIAKDARRVARNASPANVAAVDEAVFALNAHTRPLINEMQAICPTI